MKHPNLLRMLILTVFIAACNNNNKVINPSADVFKSYISALPASVVSKEDPIRLVLTQNADSQLLARYESAESLFDFSPSISGKARWLNARTIEFLPDEPLKSGQLYIAKFKLNKLFDVNKNQETFEFSFNTIEQRFNVQVDGYKTYKRNYLTRVKIDGTLYAADKIKLEAVEKTLSATQENQPLPIQWELNGDGKSFRFVIDSVRRHEKPSKVSIVWNGKKIDADVKGETTFSIPALDEFSLIKTEVIHQPDQYVILQFSDPLAENQNLDGLIRLENGTSVSTSIHDNEVKVYPSTRQGGTLNLTIEKGLRNILDYKLKNTLIEQISFEALKPAIKLIGSGSIVPRSESVLFPFQAVNLKAVDVRILQIFENNIMQFLQVNRIDGEYQLRRVGKRVFQQTISLEGAAADLGRWNTFSLDLANLIDINPGAIYSIELTFRQKHAIFPCAAAETEDQSDDVTEVSDEETDYWDAYDRYYYEGYPIDWDERDNPCNRAYYNANRAVKRNILASDLGIMTKKDGSNQLQVIVTDLKTAKPLENVSVEIYDYQQQMLVSGTTDNQGTTTLEIQDEPWFVIAKHQTQNGYLRIDDGSSLSLSKFDVDGQVVQEGLKGYIFGERGVWRPGDTLFLSFILEDKNNLLPDNHPVILELYNPKNQRIVKKVETHGPNGFYQFTVPTDPQALTGYWQAKVKTGGQTFTKDLRIETIKPNRLKIDFSLKNEWLTNSNPQIEADLQVNWLHGAPARGVRTTINASLSNTRTTFDNYPDYTFRDPSRKTFTEDFSLFDGTVNEQGTKAIQTRMKVNQQPPGLMNANFIIRAFENGGDFSIDHFTETFYPYDHYLGMQVPEGDRWGRLVTDSTHYIDVVSVDKSGSPVQLSNLTVDVYKLNWRWWWDASGDNLADYVSGNYNARIQHSTVSTDANGRARVAFRINYPEWGRYYIRIYDPQGKHASGRIVYVDWPYSAGRKRDVNPEAASMLTFAADKEKYQVGETAVVTLPETQLGRAWVSIENGSKIMDGFWLETKQGSTTFELPITSAMAPTIYVYISLLQPHGQTVNDLPIRMYGVLPLQVEDPQTILHPLLAAPEVIRPEESYTLSVSEQNKKPMTYVLAVVDEGLLDLTRFKTPDPHAHFYAREALGVKTWDMYNDVLGAYGGKIQQIFSIGGDGEEEAEGSKRANRFKPVVQFIGPFTLKGNKVDRHTLTMPNYVGSVRVMLIAATNGSYGMAEKTVPVKKPLMVIATLPRVTGPGERLKIPVSVFAMDESIKKATLSITTNDIIKPSSETSKEILFKQTGEEMSLFEVEVAKTLGIAKVTIEAKSGRESARYDVEMEVRNPLPPVSRYMDAALQPGETWETPYELPGIQGTNEAMLEVSGIPPVDFGRRLKYLLNYPHGCVEQITSSAFPQLYLTDVMEANATMKSMVERNVKAAIQQLQKFMLAGGGLGYWPDSREASDWGTSYAGHFMLEAETKGYTLPYGFKEGWINYQKKTARQWQAGRGKFRYERYSENDLQQAYRLYTLALAGDPLLSAMNRLREYEDLSVQARWRLASAYLLAGQSAVADELTRGLSTEVTNSNAFSSTYGSSLRDKAMVLESLALAGKQDQGISLIREMSDKLSKNTWMSTQTTAYSLLAISKFTGSGSVGEPISYEYTLNNNSTVNARTNLPLSQVQLETSNVNGTLRVKNSGKGMAFVRLIMHGQPMEDTMQPVEDNMVFNVRYFYSDGSTANIAELKQGTDFYAEVTISNPSENYYKDLALTQIFPSGWEIHNTRMYGSLSTIHSDTPDYQDIRDDRVYTYFDLAPRKAKTFVVSLNAAYLGSFYLPPVQCEAMYNANIKARTAGQWIKVMQP